MTAPQHGSVTVVVSGRRWVAEGVVELTLAAPEGASLPAWELGSHVDLFLPSQGVRQYSLCGISSRSWRIAVLREESGRGGSRWIVDEVRVGDTLSASEPRSHFPFDPRESAPVVLIAGGIGITPILPMAAAARAAGRDYVLHYAGHRSRMGFVDELAELHRESLMLHISDDEERMDLSDVFADARERRAEVVCCGPVRLIEAVVLEGARAGVEVTVERFEPMENAAAPRWDGPFEVELAQSGLTLEVQPKESVLTAMENAGVFVLSSCAEGTCGTCETPVLSGEVDHRDSILTPVQRARNDAMYVCVSRAACPRLVLDA